MKKTEFIKNLILNQEKDIKTWSTKHNIPYETVRSVLSRGVDKTTLTTMNKICSALNITLSDLERIDTEQYSHTAQKNTITTIGRNGEKREYTISDEDLDLVNGLLNKISKKNN